MAEKREIYYDEDPHNERDNVLVMRLAHIWRIHQAGTGGVCDDSLTTSSISPISTIDLGSEKHIQCKPEIVCWMHMLLPASLQTL